MITEEEFQAALDANPTDFVTKLVFADWLDEQGDERADGYRAMGLGRLAPMYYHYGKFWYWMETVTGRPYGNVLPWWWHDKLKNAQSKSRRAMDDEAARAFLKILPRRRAELLQQTARY